MNNTPDYENNLAFEPDITWEDFVEWFDEVSAKTMGEGFFETKPIWLEEYLEGEGVCNYVRYRYKEDTFRVNEDKTLYLNDVESEYKSFKAIKNVITAIMEGVK